MSNNEPKITKASIYISKHKRLCFLIAQMIILSIYFSVYYIGDNTYYADLRAWFVNLFVFAILPIVDKLVGEDASDHGDNTVEELNHPKYYRFLCLSILPIYTGLLIWGMYVLSSWETLSGFGQVGWIISIGIYGGSLGINAAHELLHKTGKIENISGGLLLALVSYAGFKIQHVYGHHVHVSTPEDTTSSRYNQSIYSFVPQAYVNNFTNAWKLQAKRLARRNISIFSLKNELIIYNGFSLLILTAFIVWQGWLGAIYFIGTSFVSFTLLEITNYIEHYGLHREKLENGHYERVTPEHSWNANYLVTNLFLFNLQLHSDHHANPTRPYQLLKSYDNSPQLPAAYATMAMLSFYPPLWRKVMNPKVDAYYEDRMEVLTKG